MSWTLLEAANANVSRVLHRALEGKDISHEEGYQLFDAKGADLGALFFTASYLRDRGKRNTVTFSRKVFIPLTNLCRNRCGYCTFVRSPGDADVHIMAPAEIRQLAVEGKYHGCKEALFTCGEKPELRYPEVKDLLGKLGYRSLVQYLSEMCRTVVEDTGLLPHSNPGILDRQEVAALGEINASMGLMLESTSHRLERLGGPHEFSPGKRPHLRLATIAYAGELQIPFTTGILIGIGETPEERIDSIFAIKELHRRYGHIQEVIIQNFRAKAGTPMQLYREPRPLDMMRTLAIARVIMGSDMNIQAPPNLSPDVYQLYLLAGLNDWGGISPVTADRINPEAPWPSIGELSEVTAEAGFVLKERLTVYPEYSLRRQQAVAASLGRAMAASVDESGYARVGEGGC